MLERIRRLLASPRAPLVAALVAVALFAPTIGAGLFLDDITHRSAFMPETRAPGGPQGDWDLFRFQGPDRGYLRRNLDIGIWPWWVAPSFRLAFFRPLSSLWHALDYKAWPGSPWIMHVESIAVFALMALLVGLFYRRHVKPAWAAGLAALFFAVDDAHSMVVAWVANRNAILAGALGVAALLAHDHGRRGSKRAAVLAPILFAAGLLSGEVALAAAGYIAAYAAFLDDAKVAERIRSLIPCAAVGLAWLALYKGLGYGAFGGGMYVDPGTEPLAFVRVLLLRAPLLLMGQLGLPPVDMMSMVPQEKLPAISAAFVVVLVALGALFYRVLKADRAARFFAAGMGLSLVPVAATWPSDRLLLFVGLGAFGLIAVFLGHVAEAQGRLYRPAAKVVAVAFIALHGVLAPILLPIRSQFLVMSYGRYIDRAESSIPSDAALSGDTLVFLNAPDIFAPTYPFAVRLYEGRVLPKYSRHLAIVSKGRAEVKRVDAHTISFAQSEGFFHEVWSTIFRGPGVPFRVGDVVTVPGMRVEIAEVLADGRPRRALFHFDQPLDSAALRWIRWEGTRFVAAAPPAAGETLVIEPIDFMEAISGSK